MYNAFAFKKLTVAEVKEFMALLQKRLDRKKFPRVPVKVVTKYEPGLYVQKDSYTVIKFMVNLPALHVKYGPTYSEMKYIAVKIHKEYDSGSLREEPKFNSFKWKDLHFVKYWAEIKTDCGVRQYKRSKDEEAMHLPYDSDVELLYRTRNLDTMAREMSKSLVATLETRR